MRNLGKVILFNIMKRTTTLLSALILALSLWAQPSVETQRQYLSGKDAMTWWNGISSVPVVIIPVSGVK